MSRVVGDQTDLEVAGGGGDLGAELGIGEILMAVGLALVLGYPAAIGPWLYPLYYLLLLLPRERADDRRCAAKYGPLWDEYRRRVPRRIVPGVY